MFRVIVRLMSTEREALVLLAERERRNPREQAAVLIHEELVRRGLLEPDRPDARVGSPAGAEQATAAT